MVKRFEYLEIPDKVEYVLTEKAVQLQPILLELIHGVLYYNEAAFIEYLNKWIFPGELSSLVENLGSIDSNDFLPEPYKYCLKFNF